MGKGVGEVYLKVVNELVIVGVHGRLLTFLSAFPSI